MSVAQIGELVLVSEHSYSIEQQRSFSGNQMDRNGGRGFLLENGGMIADLYVWSIISLLKHLENTIGFFYFYFFCAFIYVISFILRRRSQSEVFSSACLNFFGNQGLQCFEICFRYVSCMRI